MNGYDLEYAIAVFQEGIFTFSAKEHRRTDGNPTLLIDVKATHVEWTIKPLTQGVPDTNDKHPQKNRFDLYFLRTDFCGSVATWPKTGMPPAPWHKSPDNQGTERPGGKTIKMLYPIGRIPGISKLTAQVGIPSQPFTANALNLTLYADVEYTPKNDLYPSQLIQFHIGFQGDYQFKSGTAAPANQVVIEMTHEIYEAIRTELMKYCR